MTKILEEGTSGDHVILLLISVLHLLPSSLAKYSECLQMYFWCEEGQHYIYSCLFIGTATLITEGKSLLSLVDDRLQVIANTAEK